jgi:hypothetical protein
MKKKIFISFLCLSFVGIAVVLFELLTIRTSKVSTSNSWPQYPEHFHNVDCHHVPETIVGHSGDLFDSLRDLCWHERALHESNWRLCAYIDYPPACYYDLAIKLKDERICENISGEEEAKCQQSVREYLNRFQ